MDYTGTYRIFSLGDSAITLDFGNLVDEAVNKKIIFLFHYLKQHPLPGMIEAVPAYSSLTIYYDVLLVKKAYPLVTAFDTIKRQTEELLQKAISPVLNKKYGDATSNHFDMPVFYQGEDLEYVAKAKGLSVAEVIELHSAKTYRVYMTGFLPGFPYMGETDERIFIQRKQQPQLKVKAGSVAIAGRQTGIYPLESPGGWQIIGYTPVRIFNVKNENPVLVQAGDTVKFYPVTSNEFENY